MNDNLNEPYIQDNFQIWVISQVSEINTSDAVMGSSLTTEWALLAGNYA